jgi:hypothetical protein
LAKPEKSGILAKWVVELGEHGLEYRPRTTTKGQILVEFLIENPEGGSKDIMVILKGEEERGIPKPEANTWKLHTDGTSSAEGAGAGRPCLDRPTGHRVCLWPAFRLSKYK